MSDCNLAAMATATASGIGVEPDTDALRLERPEGMKIEGGRELPSGEAQKAALGIGEAAADVAGGLGAAEEDGPEPKPGRKLRKRDTGVEAEKSKEAVDSRDWEVEEGAVVMPVAVDALVVGPKKEADDRELERV